ncbi:hypothetical protein ACIBCN_01620 [Nocardia sp. NPDC051052]|uniref:hypothetical protein n=1 Tax=Nocardia sp. NPDC051052 TaxID=3364322 RepID=UPI00379A65C9
METVLVSGERLRVDTAMMMEILSEQMPDIVGRVPEFDGPTPRTDEKEFII